MRTTWDEYADALKDEDKKTASDWHARNGIPVSVERVGWTENYTSAAYRRWLEPTGKE